MTPLHFAFQSSHPKISYGIEGVDSMIKRNKGPIGHLSGSGRGFYQSKVLFSTGTDPMCTEAVKIEEASI